jgi:hypothetical protein
MLLMGLVGPALWGCSGTEGAVCSVDSDCERGLWCDRRVSRCAALECEGVDCVLPALEDSSEADGATGEDDTPSPADVGGGDGANPTDAGPGDTQTPEDPCPADSATGESARYRVTAIRVGKSGRPPEGLDVDGNPRTCAPRNDCEAGIDNGFAGVSSAVSLFYDPSIADGSLRLGVELSDTGCGELRLVYLDDSEGFDVAPESRAGGGYKTALRPTSLSGGELEAGPGGTLTVPLLVLGVLIEVPMDRPQAAGNMTGDPAVVTWAGQVSLANLEAAVRSIPEEKLELVGGHDGALSLLSGLYVPDLDLDEDGTADAVSLGLVTELQPVE